MSYARLLGVTLGTGLGSAFIAKRNLITEGEAVPPRGLLYSCTFENQRADDVFSTRGLLARMCERGIDVTEIASSMQNTDAQELSETFASFGADLGNFLRGLSQISARRLFWSPVELPGYGSIFAHL